MADRYTAALAASADVHQYNDPFMRRVGYVLDLEVDLVERFLQRVEVVPDALPTPEHATFAAANVEWKTHSSDQRASRATRSRLLLDSTAFRAISMFSSDIA